MKKVLLSLIFLVCSFVLFAQKDTVIISEEDGALEMQEKKYLEKYFVKDTIQENQLWKVNVVNWGLLNPSLNFEKRIYKNLSFEIGAQYKFSKNFRANGFFSHGVFLNANIRCYHNIGTRLRKGKNTNGFSGNYFSIGYDLRSGQVYKKPINEERKLEYTWDSKTYNLVYGIQRRIGNIGYIDIGVGVQYSNGYSYFEGYRFEPNTISPVYKIAIGFAKPSFRRKKVKL